MSAGAKFRERVTLHTPLPAESDGMGGKLKAGPDTTAETNAAVKQLAAREDLINGKIVYRHPYRVTLRYTSSITANQRLTWEGRSLNISSVIHDERKTETTLICYAVG